MLQPASTPSTTKAIPKLMKSGVSPMTKLIHRNKYIYGLAVLALLALSSGAGVKWGN